MGNSTEDYLDNLLKKAIAMDEGDYEIEPELDDVIEDVDVFGNYSEESPAVTEEPGEVVAEEPIETFEEIPTGIDSEIATDIDSEIFAGSDLESLLDMPLDLETPVESNQDILTEFAFEAESELENESQSEFEQETEPDLGIEQEFDFESVTEPEQNQDAMTDNESGELFDNQDQENETTDGNIDDELSSILEDAFGNSPESDMGTDENIEENAETEAFDDKLADEEIDSLLNSLGEIDSAFGSAGEEEENQEDPGISIDEEEGVSDSFSSAAENMDLSDLLSDLGQNDEELSEINDLLDKDANSEIVDFGTDTMDSLFNDDSGSDDFDLTNLLEEETTDDSGESKADKRRRKKEEKAAKKLAKKEKRNLEEGESDAEPVKKEGFFSRLFSAFGDDEDDNNEETTDAFENSALDIAAEGALENEAILENLDNEGTSEGKKNKKDKKKKDKKKKDAGEEKAEKKEKKKKEKKEKIPEPPLKKLPKAKIIVITILVASIGAIMILFANYFPYAMDMINANKHYVTGNYEKAYNYFSGHDLSEDNQEIFRKTTVLLKLQRQMDSYKNYMKMGMKAEALNALVQGIDASDTYASQAEELGISNQFNTLSSTIETELRNAFGISRDDARALIEKEGTAEYTKSIYAYLGLSPQTPALVNGSDEVPSQSEIQIIIQNENEDNEAEGQL